MKYSFGVLKPDCLKRGLVEDVFGLVRSGGLDIVFSRRQMLTTSDAEFLYSRCKESDFFQGLIEFMTSGEVIIYIVKSEDQICAIDSLNRVTGHTNPADAKPQTLRNLGISIRENIAHSTADESTFWSEVNYFLTENEISELKLGPS